MIIKDITKPVYVAAYRHVGHSYTVIHGSNEGDWNQKEYIRISDVVEIEFEPRSRDMVVSAEVSALDAVRADIVAEFTAKLKAVDTRRNDLLALTQGEQQ